MSRGWRIPAHAGQYSYEWLHQERREQLNTHFLTIRDLQGQLSSGERCVKLDIGGWRQAGNSSYCANDSLLQYKYKNIRRIVTTHDLAHECKYFLIIPFLPAQSLYPLSQCNTVLLLLYDDSIQEPGVT